LRYIFFLLFLYNITLFSSEIVHVKISKIHGLVSFAHSLSNLPYNVKSYKTLYLKHYPKSSLTEIKNNTQKIYNTKVYNYIKQQSSFSLSITELQKRVLGDARFQNTKDINNYFLSLKNIMPRYEELIYDDSLKKLTEIKKQIKLLLLQTNYNHLIIRAAKFYGVKETDIPPVYLSLTPITQGKTTTAYMLGNVESIGILINKQRLNLPWLLSATLFHEIMHLFYKQNYNEIKDLLYQNNFVTYQNQKVFNESLATAFGAGWAFYKLTRKQSNGMWYNNQLYDKTAKSIYMMLSRYMQADKKLDDSFIQKMYENYQNLVLLHK